MLLVPGTTWDPLGPITDEPLRDGHDVICLHTMAGTFAGTDAMFHQNGYSGTESDIGVAGSGMAKQWTDLMRQADANLNGNHHVISIENADKGENFPSWSGSNVPPFTSAQVAKLIELCVTMCRKEFHATCPSSWTCHQVGIPAVLIPDTCNRRGIGYHRQGIPGNFSDGLKPGCELWSKSFGKPCPGDQRIGQIKAVIIPEVARRLAAGQDPTNKEIDDMPFEIVADNKPPRLVVGGMVMGWDSGTRRARVLAALRGKGMTVPTVTLTADDWTYMSDGLITAADFTKGYFAQVLPTSDIYYILSDHSGKIPPGPTQDWVRNLIILSKGSTKPVTITDAVLDGIPTLA